MIHLSRKLWPIASALALAMSAPALAADTAQTAVSGAGTSATATATTSTGWDGNSLRVLDDDDNTIRDRNGLTADQLEEMDVTNAAGETIGEIEDVFVDQNNQIVAVSVEAGGFLGVGEREHIVGLDQLELRGEQFVTTMSSEQLEQLPRWER